jgi:hypothetical protein
MTDETAQSDRTELSDDELEAQAGEELPERAAMSVVATDVIGPDGPPDVIVDDPEGDGIVANPNPYPKDTV